MNKTRITIISIIIIIILVGIAKSSFLDSNINLEGKDTQINNQISNNFNHISINQFKEELNNKEVVLIDVRTPEELITYGKIQENQILINTQDIDFYFQILNLDKTKKYLIYCWHGTRSKATRNFMKEQGFIYVKDLKGGIDAWKNADEEILKQ